MPDLDRLPLGLDEAECRRLLGMAAIGRLALTEHALPMLLPARYTLRGDELLLAPLCPLGHSVAGGGAILAFAADRCDEVTGEGWAVTVIGPSRTISDPTQIPADFGHPTSHDRFICVAIGLAILRGHRLAAPRGGNPGSPARPSPGGRAAVTVDR